MSKIIKINGWKSKNVFIKSEEKIENNNPYCPTYKEVNQLI